MSWNPYFGHDPGDEDFPILFIHATIKGHGVTVEMNTDGTWLQNWGVIGLKEADVSRMIAFLQGEKKRQQEAGILREPRRHPRNGRLRAEVHWTLEPFDPPDWL